jgi:3-dehydroquinate synthase
VSVAEVCVVPALAGQGGYPVRIGPGATGTLPGDLPAWAPAHAYALVSDEHVMPLHGVALAERLRSRGLRVETFEIRAGEEHKTRAEWGRLTDALLARGIGRDSAVLALGGGVVGDLAGFVAATYMRGVPVIQIPTTLLAMVDASVGGKTGVDTPAGKNLVGAFHAPVAVVADTDLLASLSAAHLRAGLAEALKHGLVADTGYLHRTEAEMGRLLAADAEALAALVLRSVEIKAGVVGRDPHERGERRMLNFGHTLGHALETVTGYAIQHGHAVALGMVLEAQVGEWLGVTRPGTAARVGTLVRSAGLPYRLPEGLDPERLLAATKHDKKARRGLVEYALLRGPGEADPGESGRWSRPVPDHVVLAVLETAGSATPSGESDS